MRVRRLLRRISLGLKRFPNPAMLAARAGFYLRRIRKSVGPEQNPGNLLGRIELSLAPDYVDWGLWESMREFFQNAKDAEELGYKMSVQYNRDLRTLRITTAGAHLERKTLVLGASTKRGQDLRGKFGEGYKLAIACLLHNGRQVRIYNWDEVWIPAIEFSDTFQTNVLVIKIVAAEKTRPELIFEVDEISEFDYRNTINSKLLFDQTVELSKTTTKSGAFLPQSAWVNSLFVREIFVAQLPGIYRFGYDLRYAALNRDRNLADPWTLKREIHNVLDEALEAGTLDPNILFDAIEEGLDEGIAIRDSLWKGSLIPDALIEIFFKRYGEDAVPVCTQRDITLAHLIGREPITINQNLAAIMAFGGLDVEHLRGSHSLDYAKIYNEADLTKKEKENLQIAVHLARGVESFKDPLVVDYVKKEIQGLYNNGEISLARGVLSNRRKTIGYLVHEVAHRYGPDGSVGHREAEERIFSQIIYNLDNRSHQ